MRAAAPLHRLSDLDVERRTASCSVCGQTTIRKHGFKRGKQDWRCATPVRVSGLRSVTKWRMKGYKGHRGNVCERCGFAHVDRRVFDVHHRNGDHDDDRVENLETLCPTCHRIEHLGIER